MTTLLAPMTDPSPMVTLPTALTTASAATLTPAGVDRLRSAGHEVWVETNAGVGSALTDDMFKKAGAKIAADAASVWKSCEMTMKVKEPLESEWKHMRPGQTVFTYFHLAADKKLTAGVMKTGAHCFAYETLEHNGGLNGFQIDDHGVMLAPQGTLKRADIYGKTGTTNDSMDAWFAGYQKDLVAVVWIGYDQPRKLGDKETGGGLSLPVWIEFMAQALKNKPQSELEPPEGVVHIGNEWFYDEYSGKDGVRELTGDEGIPSTVSEEEKKSILDIFKR